jgi:hypothetical protein
MKGTPAIHWQVALGVEVDSRDDANQSSKHLPRNTNAPACMRTPFERLAVAQAAGVAAVGSPDHVIRRGEPL